MIADPHLPPVAGDEPVLALPGLTRRVVVVVGGELPLTVVGVQQLHPDVGLVEPLLAWVAEDLLDVRRHEQGPAFVIGAHLVHDRGHLFHEHAVATLRGPEIGLGLAGGRQIDDDPLPRRLAGGRVDDHARFVAHPHLVPVGVQEPVLDLPSGAVLPTVGPRRVRRDAVLGVQRAEPHGGVGDVLLSGVPQHVDDVGTHVPASLRRPVGIDVHDHRKVLDQLAVASLGAIQHDRRLSLGGDVQQHALPERALAVAAFHHHRVIADPHHAAVGLDVAVLGAEGLPRRDALGPRLAHPVEIIGVHRGEPEVGVREVVGGVVAEHGASIGAHVQAPRSWFVGIDVDHHRQPLDERAVASLGAFRLRVGEPLRGDVLDEALPVLHGAVGSQHRCGRLAEPSPFPVAVLEPIVGFEPGPAHHRRCPLVPGLGSTVGVHAPEPQLGMLEQLAGWEPRDLLHPGARIEHTGVRLAGQQHDRCRGVFDDAPEDELVVGKPGGLGHGWRVARGRRVGKLMARRGREGPA